MEASGGSIMIDGKDIQSLPLYEVRKNIAIVPQVRDEMFCLMYDM